MEAASLADRIDAAIAFARSARDGRGWTETRLAKVLGVDRSYLHRVIRREPKYVPDEERSRKVAWLILERLEHLEYELEQQRNPDITTLQYDDPDFTPTWWVPEIEEHHMLLHRMHLYRLRGLHSQVSGAEFINICRELMAFAAEAPVQIAAATVANFFLYFGGALRCTEPARLNPALLAERLDFAHRLFKNGERGLAFLQDPSIREFQQAKIDVYGGGTLMFGGAILSSGAHVELGWQRVRRSLDVPHAPADGFLATGLVATEACLALSAPHGVEIARELLDVARRIHAAPERDRYRDDGRDRHGALVDALESFHVPNLSRVWREAEPDWVEAVCPAEEEADRGRTKHGQEVSTDGRHA